MSELSETIEALLAEVRRRDARVDAAMKRMTDEYSQWPDMRDCLVNEDDYALGLTLLRYLQRSPSWNFPLEEAGFHFWKAFLAAHRTVEPDLEY